MSLFFADREASEEVAPVEPPDDLCHRGSRVTDGAAQADSAVLASHTVVAMYTLLNGSHVRPVDLQIGIKTKEE